VWVRIDPYCFRPGNEWFDDYFNPCYSVASVQLEWNRLRIGTAVIEDPVGVDMLGATSYLPLRLGCTIWRHPVGYLGRVGGMAPEVSTEVLLNWWNTSSDEWTRIPVVAKAQAVVGADMVGLGVSLAAGVMYFESFDRHIGRWVEHHRFLPCAELRFRPGTFAYHLTGVPLRPVTASPGIRSDSGYLSASPETAYSPWHPRFGDRKPRWLLRVEMLSCGYEGIYGLYKHYMTYCPASSYVRVEAEWWRLRLGVGFANQFEKSMYSLFPLSIGFTLWQRPHNYAGRLFGKLPEVYLRYSEEGILNDPPPYLSVGTLELVGSADSYGVGLAAAVGVRCVRCDYPQVLPKPIYTFNPFIGIRVRLLTLAAGF
jgi:hypothetical protein